MKRDVAKDRPDDLPTLLGKLADDTTELLDTKLALLKVELKEEAAAYVRGVAMIVVGVGLALMGLALLNIALAFLVSTLLNATSLSEPARYGIGFGSTALVYVILGAVLIVISKNNLAEQDVVPPRTVAELKRDKQILEEEL